jgi:hypothetical protein
MKNMKNVIKGILAVGVAVALAAGIKAVNEYQGYVYLPKTGVLDSRIAYKSEGSQVYDRCVQSFIASPRGGNVNYNRPLTLQESNLVNKVELK